MFCWSSTTSYSTHSLYVTVTLSMYLPLLLYQSPRCPIALQSRQCFSLILILSYSFLTTLCLFYFHHLPLTLSLYPLLFSIQVRSFTGSFFFMNLMKMIKWQNFKVSFLAFTKIIQSHVHSHLSLIWNFFRSVSFSLFLSLTLSLSLSLCPSYPNVPSFSLIWILLLLCLPLSHYLWYSFLDFFSNYSSLSPSFSICESLHFWSSVTQLFYQSLCLAVFISLDFFI